MELVDGTELSDILRGAGPLPGSALLELGIQLASGLEHAHRLVHKGAELGFVHRDLKPSNVILSQDGLAKITDFGIATSALITGLDTGDGVTKGTPAYMAPEQAAGGSIDGRADLFALGAILYQAGTGRRLFRGNSAAATMMSVLHVEQVWEQRGVREAADEVAPGLSTVLGWCLRRDPDDRYADATLVREALEELELAAAPGPGLRRWIGDLPGRGTGHRGLRMRRRHFMAAAGAPRFDPKRDLNCAAQAEASAPERAVKVSPGPLGGTVERESEIRSPVTPLPAARPRRALWRRLVGSIAVVVPLGLLIGMGAVLLAERLAAPAPEQVGVVGVTIEDAIQPPAVDAIPEAPPDDAQVEVVEAVPSPDTPPGGAEVGALAGPVLGSAAPPRIVVHAGAAAVGEPGEAADQERLSDRERHGAPGVELGNGVANRRQEPETMVERSETTRRAASGTDGVNEGEVRVGHEVDRETDVEPDVEGAVPTPLVLIHPRPVRRVRVGQRPSFIVRSEQGHIASGALLLRSGGGAWERHPLIPYSEGFWGTKVYVTTDMERGFDYYFEVDGGAGSAALRDADGPYRVAVAR
jgi:hypothetical protein